MRAADVVGERMKCVAEPKMANTEVYAGLVGAVARTVWSRSVQLNTILYLLYN